MEPEYIDKIWEKGIPVKGVPPQILRKDPCGALMIRAKFGDRTSEFGWEIDHIYPQINGGDDDLDNLRPMNWRNNLSKGSDYPVYYSAVTAKGSLNVSSVAQFRINDSTQEKLKEKYGSKS